MKGFFMVSSSFPGQNASVRLLVVEDDPTLGTVLERGLREEGYAIDLVTRVLDAKHCLASNEYDAAILDLGLPDGDGLEICRTMRADGISIPVLILTARDGLSDKVEGLDAGADDYLPKPFDYPELTARIRALLRRPADTQPTVLSYGDISLDPASRRVWRGAITVPLTAKEFGLLEYLLRHATEVVPRSDLIEHVWDAHYDGLSNVVDVHIANLRRKLDLPGAPAPIETLRGVGYVLGER